MIRRILLFGIVATSHLCSMAQTSSPQQLSELVNDQDPGWPLVESWVKQAKNHVQVLPRNPHQAAETLVAVQVTTRSPMGAVIYETGGILVDHGWLRILGSGAEALNRDLATWNRGRQNGFLLVADDVVGGFFALNGGAFGQESLGQVFYLAPNNLQWEATEKTYSEFLVFCFSGNLDKFYKGLRWPGWEKELEAQDGTTSFAFYPFLFTAEGQDIRKTARRLVPVAEIWTLHTQFRQQLNIH